jgi:uncharacterized membrane protein YdjX (TVP38/TMEM64 family)
LLLFVGMTLWLRLGLLLLAVLGGYLILQGDLSAFERLQASRGSLEERFQQEPVAVLAAYFATHAALTALLVPGAIVLSLAAGAVFGLFWGTLVAALAASFGMTLGFLAVRRLFPDLRQVPAISRLLARFRQGGALDLLALRLVPVVPYPLVNIAMALSPIRARAFFGATLLGTLPLTAVYVNAGTRLASLRSPDEVLSPGVLTSLAAIALVPWLARLALGRTRRARRAATGS